MEPATLSVLLVSITAMILEAAIGTIVGLVIKKQWTKREDERKRLAELEKQAFDQEENKRCDAMKDTIHKEIEEMRKGFQDDITPLKENVVLMKETMQKDTRRSLRQDAETYLARGWATHQEKTEYDELYWCYHNLGRNGVVDGEHDEVMKLPSMPKGE